MYSINYLNKRPVTACGSQQMGLHGVESDVVHGVHSPLECAAGHVSAACPQLRSLSARGECVSRGGDAEPSHHVLADYRVKGQVGPRLLLSPPNFNGLVIPDCQKLPSCRLEIT